MSQHILNSLSFGARQNSRRAILRRSTIMAGSCLGLFAGLAVTAPRAQAYTAYSNTVDGQDLDINLDATVEYSNIFRVGKPSAILESGINGDEGDRDFPHGLVSNLFDVQPVFDLKWGNFGAHVSGEAYLNTVYLQHNANNSPSTFNPISTTDNKSFTSATRNLEGENARLLDAYAYDSVNFGADGGQTATIKIGRQTLLWGQSLFFSQNGIAAGQAPIDVITAQNLANPQTAQVILPVGQIVATYQPNSMFTFQAYYQFEYQHFVFQGVGAYFSSADILDKGGQRLLFPPGPGIPRSKDNLPEHQNGQFGASVQIQIADIDLGFYGLRYDSKTPEVNFASNFSSYNLVYPRDIEIYGSSISTNIGAANVAAEVSGRTHMPLVGGATTGDVNSNESPLYPVGSTLAAQASMIYVSPGLPLIPGGVSVDGEFAMNRLLSVDRNQAALTPGRDKTAGAFDVGVTPNYYNVLPNLNLAFPLGINYGLFGRSQVSAGMNHGVGTYDIGVTATYRATWTAGLTYQGVLGEPSASLNPTADRSYVSFNVEHTF